VQPDQSRSCGICLPVSRRRQDRGGDGLATPQRYFLRRTATTLSCRFTSKRFIASSRPLSFE